MAASNLVLTRRQVLAMLTAAAGSRVCPAFADDAGGIAPQPYFASVGRAVESMAESGAPIAVADAERIAELAQKRGIDAVEAAERILDQYVLARLSLDDDGSVQVAPGGAKRELVEQGWRMFLLRIENHAEARADLNFSEGWPKPGRMAPGEGSSAQRPTLMDTVNKAPIVEKLWLLSQLHAASTHTPNGFEFPVIPLSGSPVEYHVLHVFSRDHGSRSTNFTLTVIPKDEDWRNWARATKEFQFDCLPTRYVELLVKDADGVGCVASLTIKDSRDWVYPPQVMRLAPDMFFQEHIYRGDGETIRLPDGEYTLESKRGPEYLRTIQHVQIGKGNPQIRVRLERWIDPAKWGWYSGDTHIHAAGCAHYQIPTEGVSPETMIRHLRGEGLSIGEVLSWGPSWYYQKQFFSGQAQSPVATLEHPELQAANNATWQTQPTPKDRESLLRYDVEVSGFPSSLSGHLVLLRLKKQDYPGTELIEDWPSWNLPILQWAKAQGAVVGYAHGALGMVVESKDLPNYEIPPFDSIGTNEAIVDVTHGVTDFLSGCNLFPLAELNAWYHVLNCGFRLAMVGETDYPCISGERPGVGRTYVRLDRRPMDDLGYQTWVDGIQQGRLYCGDGRSHFLEFTVEGRDSDEEVRLDSLGTVRVKATVAARLEPEPTAETEAIRNAATLGWHAENARIADSREVAVELIVNGLAVDKVAIVADGSPRDIHFEAALTCSSWVALRVFPSAHTHPVFVLINGKPIRASKRSAEWCRSCVDKLWEVKAPFIRDSERPEASKAYDHARKVYDAIAHACEAE